MSRRENPEASIGETEIVAPSRPGESKARGGDRGRCTSRSVLITGTTSGVGLGLLDHYVRSGARVIAVNRRRVIDLESRYPAVRFEHVDVRAAEAVHCLVHALAASGELPEVFILNAGINRIDNDSAFQLAPYREVLETNLFGVLNFVAPLTEIPPDSVQRHVVAISSMAGFVGNPYGLGYYTSKRTLSACFEVLAKMYSGTDLVFQRVMLGPVRTAIYTMADQFPRWMVWLKNAFSASLDDTVTAIARFAITRSRLLIHPRRALLLYFAMWLGQRLVPGFFQGHKTLDGRSRRVPEPQRGASCHDTCIR